MDSVEIKIGDVEVISARFVSASGSGVTGLTGGSAPTISIRRVVDDQFWNGSGYQAGDPGLTMSEVSAANHPGWYDYDLDTTAGATVGQHVVTAAAASASVVNSPQQGEVRVGLLAGEVDVVKADTDSLRDHVEGRKQFDQSSPSQHQEVIYRRTGSRSGAGGTVLQRYDVDDQAGNAVSDANPLPQSPASPFDRTPA